MRRIGFETPKPVLLLRLSGGFACLVSAIGYLADRLWATQSGRDGALVELVASHLPRLLTDTIRTGGPILVAILFWRATRMDRDEPPRWALPALGLQLVLALTASFDLLPSIALEAGLLFPGRLGLVWVLGQASIEFAVCSLSPRLQQWLLGPGPPPNWQYYAVVGSVQCLFIHLVTYACGSMGASERSQRRHLTEQNSRLAQLNRELVAMKQMENEAVRLGERLRISRELHDAVGHHLTALSLKLQFAARVSRDTAQPAIAEAYQLVRLLLSDVRSVVKDLRDSEPFDLNQSLQALIGHCDQPRVTVDWEGGTLPLGPERARILYRCLQEALTNTLKHADASNLWIDVKSDGERVLVETRDDGRGTSALRLGNGLRGMSERVEQCGGQLELVTSPGQGFAIRFWVPAEPYTRADRYAAG